MRQLDIREIKAGDTFYECESGINILYLALEDAHRKPGDEKYFEVRVLRKKTGEIFDIGWNEGYPAYKLKLYKEPQYVNVRTWQATIN